MSRQVHHPDIARLNSDGSCLPLEKQNIFPTQLYSFHNPMASISSTAMQQRDVARQPDLSFFHQDTQFGQQNMSWQRNPRHQPLYQQSMSVQEPNWTSISMLNMNRGQRSVEASHQHQLCNVLAQPMLHQASSTQLLQRLVNSQEQRNQFQDSRTQGSQIPATYLHSQNVTCENTYIMPSQMGLAETATDVAAWQSLITQFRLMRLRYLPDVLKLQEKAKDQYAHAQSLEQLQRNRHVMAVTARMIEFLHLTEHQVILLPKDKLMDFMNQIIRFVEKNSAGIQALQMSSSHGDQDLSLRMSQAPQRMLQLGNPQMLLEKKDNLLLSPVTNATSGICKPNFSRHQLPENSSLSLPSLPPHNVQPLLSTKVPQSFSLLDQTKDIPYLSDPGASLEPETSIFGFDLPMNPSTQSSVPMKISKPDESFLLASSPKKNVESQTGASKENVESQAGASKENVESQTGASKENVESQSGASKENVEATKVLDQSTSLAKPGISVVTSQPDSTGSESKQFSQSATQPNDRLAEAVQSTSDTNLTGSIDDMFSSINAMDRLLEFAFEDEFQWNMHTDMESFLGRRSTQEIDDDNEGDIPLKKLKCDIGSSSRDASMTMDKDDTSKSSK